MRKKSVRVFVHIDLHATPHRTPTADCFLALWTTRRSKAAVRFITQVTHALTSASLASPLRHVIEEIRDSPVRRSAVREQLKSILSKHLLWSAESVVRVAVATQTDSETKGLYRAILLRYVPIGTGEPSGQSQYKVDDWLRWLQADLHLLKRRKRAFRTKR